jgi:hypothetical protein
MERRADTPTRISRRKYEDTHKEKRHEQNKVWGTSIPRRDAEAIDDFLKTHFMSKVDLIMVGYKVLQEQVKSTK